MTSISPQPGHLDAAGVLDLDPGPEMRTSPGSSSGPDPAGGHAGERRGGAGRHGPGHQGAGRCGCPERLSSCSGITLSDEGGQGERARTRRYARLRAASPEVAPACRSGYSGGLRVSSWPECHFRGQP
jgi:hypothetical protein